MRVWARASVWVPPANGPRARTNDTEEDAMALQTTERYCPICGKPVTDPTYDRFGELCCSEAHAEAYVKEIRAQKIHAHATAGTGQPLPRQMCGG